MELGELIKLTKNLYDHFHLKRKTNLTDDEYRLCQSLLSYNVELKSLFNGLSVIHNDIKSFGRLRISGINKND